ncbi:carboxy terminal-processing peptidase [soil metagenome]
MLYRFHFSLLFLVWMVSVSFNTQAQHLKQHQEAILLQKVLEKNHFSPPTLDDSFSSQVFNDFIRTIDPRQLHFSESDLKDLSKHKHSIDDELKGKSWLFFPHVSRLYKDRLLESLQFCELILEKPFDFSLQESIIFPNNDSTFFAGQSKFQRWEKWLKYQTLTQILNEVDIDSLIGDNDFYTREPELRQKVKSIEHRKIKKLLDHPYGFENQLLSVFFNSITSCYDPHSAYFSKTDWQNFQSSLSKESYSYGLDLEEDQKGNISIVRLVPGGPAWKTNELHKGDVLHKIKWQNKNEIDLTGADVNEVRHMLEQSNSEKLELTVKNPLNGQVKTVALLKEKIREEDNIVKSFILNGSHKIGYISLPGFYTAWGEKAGQGCASDVSKEIVKLKSEKIDGLILDIRYNGGGSLIEGLNLAGIFIDEGPLFALKGRDGQTTVLRDMNRGTVYDGPLVVMVNGQSASASEILASTLQDYNRAVIIGSPTFGKATGQNLLPLEENPKNLINNKSSWGNVTVTVEKIYRVNGKSAQLNGVIPDISLPEVYEDMHIRENDYSFALPNDSINKKIIYKPLPALPKDILKVKSEERIMGNISFQFIKEIKKAESWNNGPVQEISLNLSDYKAQNNKHLLWQQLMQAIDNYENNENTFMVNNNSYDYSLIALDNYGKEINEVVIKNLQTDIYIKETCQILSDLIEISINK